MQDDWNPTRKIGNVTLLWFAASCAAWIFLGALPADGTAAQVIHATKACTRGQQICQLGMFGALL
eukprot:1840989-Amphidinium_carterae.1